MLGNLGGLLGAAAPVSNVMTTSKPASCYRLWAMFWNLLLTSSVCNFCRQLTIVFPKSHCAPLRFFLDSAFFLEPRVLLWIQD